MGIIRGYQRAQIGVIAVLLTAVLLVVGISVTTRVANQVAQETSRMESNQLLNQAESLIDAPDELEGELPNTMKSQTMDASSANDTIYLQPGEAIEISLWQTKQSGTEPANAVVRWGFAEDAEQDSYDLCKSEAALLLTYVEASGNNYYLPIAPTGCSNIRNGYTEAESSSDRRYISEFTLSAWPATMPSFSEGDSSKSNILRIRALYAGTYVNFPGLTMTLRTAAANEVGSEARVEEQNQTSAAAPFINDFAIFSGNSEVCQAVDGEVDCGDSY
jgi:hypothetical protein